MSVYRERSDVDFRRAGMLVDFDTQEVLPSNDPARVRSAVEHLLSVMNPRDDGGYIFAPAHNLQTDVEPAAIACMYGCVMP